MRDRFLYLLGIRWGQFAEPWEIAEAPTAKRAKGESLVVEGGYVKGLSGMSCVIPTWHIVDLLNLPKFKELRRQQDERWKERLAKETSPSGSWPGSLPLSSRDTRNRAKCEGVDNRTVAG